MATPNSREKKFVVIAINDEKGLANTFTTLAEDHDVACHHAELSFGWGAFIALNKKQARKVYTDLKKYLQNW